MIYTNNRQTRCNTKQSIILQVHSTCFGCQPHLSSGVHKTVTAASGTGHIFCASTSLQRGQANLNTLEGGSCIVPEAVVTVLCTPDDGCSLATLEEGSCTKIWPVTEAVVAVLCIPDVGRSLATLEGGSCTKIWPVPEAVVAVLCIRDVGCSLATLEEGRRTKIWPVTEAVVAVLCIPDDGCSLATLEGGSCTKIWPVPEAVVTVLCTPDDRCSWNPKHVEWTCRKINRLLCVASRWTIINIDQRCTEP